MWFACWCCVARTLCCWWCEVGVCVCVRVWHDGMAEAACGTHGSLGTGFGVQWVGRQGLRPKGNGGALPVPRQNKAFPLFFRESGKHRDTCVVRGVWGMHSGYGLWS